MSNHIAHFNGVFCEFIFTYILLIFTFILWRADPNPIYLCELIRVCPVNDHGDASITRLVVTPSSGPRGTLFCFKLYHDKLTFNNDMTAASLFGERRWHTVNII